MAEDEQQGSGSIAAVAATARDAATAAAATAAEIPQGGGSSVQSVAGLGADIPIALRIRPNPTLSGPAPVFMPRASGQTRGTHRVEGSTCTKS